MTALSHTRPLCNLISADWLSLLSLTSHKVSPGLMSPVSIAMGLSRRVTDRKMEIVKSKQCVTEGIELTPKTGLSQANRERMSGDF